MCRNERFQKMVNQEAHFEKRANCAKEEKELQQLELCRAQTAKREEKAKREEQARREEQAKGDETATHMKQKRDRDRDRDRAYEKGNNRDREREKERDGSKKEGDGNKLSAGKGRGEDAAKKRRTDPLPANAAAGQKAGDRATSASSSAAAAASASSSASSSSATAQRLAMPRIPTTGESKTHSSLPSHASHVLRRDQWEDSNVVPAGQGSVVGTRAPTDAGSASDGMQGICNVCFETSSVRRPTTHMYVHACTRRRAHAH